MWVTLSQSDRCALWGNIICWLLLCFVSLVASRLFPADVPRWRLGSSCPIFTCWEKDTQIRFSLRQTSSIHRYLGINMMRNQYHIGPLLKVEGFLPRDAVRWRVCKWKAALLKDIWLPETDEEKQALASSFSRRTDAGILVPWWDTRDREFSSTLPCLCF